MQFLEPVVREFRVLGSMRRLLKRVGKLTPQSPDTVADIVERWARERPGNVAIYFEDKKYTYREYDAAANRYARWAQAQGLKKGDVVALLMENRPEFLFAWTGLVKIGVVAALINTNLKERALAHSLAVADAKHLILGAELAENYATSIDDMSAPIKVWTTGGKVQGTEDLDAALAAQSADPLPKGVRDGMVAADKCFYIYTSGTTGLPKAANMSHLRIQNMMHSFAAAMNSTERDRMYVVLPLYHSAGGVCAVGSVLTSGGAIIIRRRFSATNFWDDCVKYGATQFQYIGELCRYLLNSPPHKLERKHKLRVVMGNGLRPEIWSGFKARFRIPKIIEFYGATEGNVALVNVDGKIGAVGRIPRWLRNALPTRLVLFDVENEAPVRGADGFCVECKPGEIGEAIGRIDPERGRFEGYTKSTDTEKKILRDVFAKGDAWFRTGDLLKQDKAGYYYFIDRIGDTFRWKGENVATSEVAEAISIFPGVKEANVYGVKVPGTDGRAGMASLVVEGGLDLGKFKTHVEKNLPVYARPIFLRLQPEIEVTVTFKHRKVELVKEGFDPRAIKEPLYFLDPVDANYVPLTPELYDRINAGEIRL
ncbi:MAG: long-chain-acyl-CoA synthetase [Alphaproteobacteria bacterium]|nr:long-chain-acyl-CoA synthetase [Alphaproteobacteria bacterium]